MTPAVYRTLLKRKGRLEKELLESKPFSRRLPEPVGSGIAHFLATDHGVGNDRTVLGHLVSQFDLPELTVLRPIVATGAEADHDGKDLTFTDPQLGDSPEVAVVVQHVFEAQGDEVKQEVGHGSLRFLMVSVSLPSDLVESL